MKFFILNDVMSLIEFTSKVRNKVITTIQREGVFL